jgi:hypothetical protein
MTLIVRQPHYRNGILLLHPGDELAPGLLAKDEIDQLLDSGVLVEVPTRLSYFALLPDFAGAPKTRDPGIASSFPQFTIPT